MKKYILLLFVISFSFIYSQTDEEYHNVVMVLDTNFEQVGNDEKCMKSILAYDMEEQDTIILIYKTNPLHVYDTTVFQKLQIGALYKLRYKLIHRINDFYCNETYYLQDLNSIEDPKIQKIYRYNARQKMGGHILLVDVKSEPFSSVSEKTGKRLKGEDQQYYNYSTIDIFLDYRIYKELKVETYTPKPKSGKP